MNFWPLICDTQIDGFFSKIVDSPIEVLRSGKANGILLGGCLSLISSVIGTKHQPDFTGSILILEDIGEQPYRIDRYLSQLKSAGVFEKVNGVIVSKFVDCEEKEGEPTLRLDEIFADYFASLSVPVIKNFLYGHISKKFTIPIGVEIALDTDSQKVQLLEPAVKK
jgi:muramoyltetrapeptide carboxypeptidase